MAFQPVPDTAVVTGFLEGVPAGELDGSEAQFSFYVRNTITNPPWDAAALQLIADFMADWWDTGKNGGAAAKTVFSDQWSLNRIVARNLDVANGLTAEASPGIAGTLLGDPLDAATALLVRIRGDSGGSPPQGHIFFPAGDESKIAGNDFQTVFAASVAQLCTDFLTDINDPAAGGALNLAIVIVSRYASTNDNVKNARAALRAAIAATRRPTALTNTLAGYTARTLVASQRDRRPGE